MAETQKFPVAGKPAKKQNGTPPGRKQMLTLWLAAIAALGTGVPGVVDCVGRLVDGRRSSEEIQELITKQTAELTQEQRNGVDAIRKLQGDAQVHRSDFAYMQGRLELLQDVLRDCCTRRRALEKLREEPGPKPGPEPPEESDEPESLPESLMKVWVHDGAKKLPVEHLKKVPDFRQEQVQLQEPGE